METPRPGSLFAPHGRATALWEAGLLRVEVSGPFNLEGMQLLKRTMLAGYRGLPPGTPVVNLCTMRGTLVYTSDAWQALADTIRATSASGMRVLATAWVVGADVEGASLLLPRARRLFADAGRAFEVFDDDEAAVAWARRHLDDAKG